MAGTFLYIPPAGSGAGSSPYFGDPVADPASLPLTGATGELRYVISQNTVYAWGGVSWGAITVVGLDINNTTGNLPLTRTTGSLDISARTTGNLDISTRSTGSLDLGTRTSGTLTVDRGGTNSTTALANGKLMVSSGGKVVEGTPTVLNGDIGSVTSLTMTGTSGYLKLPNLTTAQRDALTASEGMLIYNTDLTRFQGYFSGAWGSLHGWGN